MNSTQPTPDFAVWRFHEGGDLEAWRLDTMMSFQDHVFFCIDVTERVGPRLNFPSMPAWGDWDYNDLMFRSRRPRLDGRTRQNARDHSTLNPQGELWAEQSAGDRHYSQYRPRVTETTGRQKRHMNEDRRTTTSIIGNPRSGVRPHRASRGH